MARVNWKRVPQPTLDPELRTGTFDEVNQNYTLEDVMAEAERCLTCGNPACVMGCPAGNPIQDYLALLREGKFMEAVRLDRTSNPLMSCTGRVCAWESQCQGACVLGLKGDPINIGAIERWLGDYANEHPELEDYDVPPSNGLKVAVIGAGPAGLTVAHFLAWKGYEVTVFEAWHVAGGVMAYGIPEYVLPQHVIDAEVERIKNYGVKILTNVHVGRDVTIEELFERGYDAIFIGIGANQARKMGVPGEDLAGIYTLIGEKVAVVGAGNTAMDAARTALRFGAGEVHIVYRRSEEQSPSRPIEIHHSKTEGVIFDYLVNPTRFIGDEDGRVKGMELIRMELGAPDRSGRPRPEPVEGSEFIMDVDTVVLAIGYDPETDLYESIPELETDRWDCIPVDSKTGATNVPGVFAGGDIVTGPQTVVQAIAAGRTAARGIDEYLQKKLEDQPEETATAND